MDINEFYEYIAALRVESGMTERGFNTKAGLSGSYLGSMKIQGNYPSLETLEVICETLDMSMSDFFAGMEKQSPKAAKLTSTCTKLFSNLEEDEVSFFIRFISRLTPDDLHALIAFLKEMDGIAKE